MKTKDIILVVFLILLLAGGLWYFKDNFFKAYKDLGNLKNVERLEETIGQIKVEIFTPKPLRISGKENESNFVKEKIIAKTNIQRYNNDTLPPLTENEKLDKVALFKVQDMFKNQYFEHISPSGVGPGDLAKSFGYDYILEGENLILGNFSSEEEMVNRWMASPGHRANILNKRFADIGVAVIKGTYKGDSVWIAVQEFGLPIAACNLPSDDLKLKIDNNKTKLDQFAQTLDYLKVEIDNSNSNSSDYNQKVQEYNKLVGQYNDLVKETKNVIAQYNDQVNIFNSCVIGNQSK